MIGRELRRLVIETDIGCELKDSGLFRFFNEAEIAIQLIKYYQFQSIKCICFNLMKNDMLEC